MTIISLIVVGLMSLLPLLSAFFAHLHSSEFLEAARHPAHARAFTRQRKLPLPDLVAVMLSGMRKSIQAELDEFFAHLDLQAQLVRHVSERAFSRARAKLSATALPALNDWLLQQAGAAGLLPTWQGLRLVAADASTLHFGHRASHVPRAACAEQIAFGLYLPGAEMMLAASLHSVYENERQMLFQHIDRPGPADLLLMDRGYPCRWLVALLNARTIPFCMRVERAGNAGFACVRDFLRSGLEEQVVVLPAPDMRDAVDYECPATPQKVRLVRHVASTGRVRVLMTNLLDTAAYPCALFGDLYHNRWRIEEAFKRLKHRLNLEHVSGLSQLAAMQDSPPKSCAITCRAWPLRPLPVMPACHKSAALTAPTPTPSSNPCFPRCCWDAWPPKPSSRRSVLSPAKATATDRGDRIQGPSRTSPIAT